MTQPRQRVLSCLLRQLLLVTLLAVPGVIAVQLLAPRVFIGVGTWLTARGWSMNAYLGAWAALCLVLIGVIACASVRAFRSASASLRAIRRGEDAST